jgi:hypothetical protein
MKRLKHRPSIACEAMFEAWGPHEGCREFMDRPDTWGCDKPATHIVKGVEQWAGPVKYRTCAEHLDQVDVAHQRAYRFRHLG